MRSTDIETILKSSKYTEKNSEYLLQQETGKKKNQWTKISKEIPYSYQAYPPTDLLNICFKKLTFSPQRGIKLLK